MTLNKVVISKNGFEATVYLTDEALKDFLSDGVVLPSVKPLPMYRSQSAGKPIPIETMSTSHIHRAILKMIRENNFIFKREYMDAEFVCEVLPSLASLFPDDDGDEIRALLDELISRRAEGTLYSHESDS